MAFSDYIPRENIPNVIGASLFIFILVLLSVLIKIFGIILLVGLLAIIVYLGVVYFKGNNLKDFKETWSDKNTKRKTREIFK